MPMFGAPRTARRAIASAVSRAPVSVSQLSAPGSSVWSRIERRRPSHRSAWIEDAPRATPQTLVATHKCAVRAEGSLLFAPPVPRTRLAAGLAALLVLLIPTAAQAAGDPIMPLA